VINRPNPVADVVPENAAGPPDLSVTQTSSDDGGVRSSDIWYQFEGFIPNPTSRFNNEFWRLSKHMRWEDEERRKFRIEIFDADWEAHIGSELGNLAHWQEFCRLCSVVPIPNSIPECMEVCATPTK
jgi:hypothetical protein